MRGRCVPSQSSSLDSGSTLNSKAGKTGSKLTSRSGIETKCAPHHIHAFSYWHFFSISFRDAVEHRVGVCRCTLVLTLALPLALAIAYWKWHLTFFSLHTMCCGCWCCWCASTSVPGPACTNHACTHAPSPWFFAQSLNEDGTYFVKYDDGDEEETVDARHIRQHPTSQSELEAAEKVAAKVELQVQKERDAEQEEKLAERVRLYRSVLQIHFASSLTLWHVGI